MQLLQTDLLHHNHLIYEEEIFNQLLLQENSNK